MKKIFLMLAVCAMSIAVSAQTTRVLKGAVIDKDGNPLPGATVNATGGSEVTTVDADGSFSMEVPIWLKRATAQYAGMKDKTLKIKGDDLIFRMKPDKRKQWFIIANYSRIVSGNYSKTMYYGYTENFRLDYSGNMGGLMFGRLGKWGWYGKINVGLLEMEVNGTTSSSYYDYSSKMTKYNTYTYHDNEDEVIGTVTAGVTKRIINPLHAYFGLGVGGFDEEAVITPEIGLIGKIKNHFLLHFGYQPSVPIDGHASAYHVLNIGLGYAF